MEPSTTAAVPLASDAAARPGRKATATRKRTSGRRLFAYDRRLGVRWVAGADEAGRGCLAGPLVAAAVLFDTEALTTRELRALSRLNDSKQHTIEVREELFPIVLRTAAKVCVVSRCARGIDDRGLHKTNLAALRDALLGVARPGCICLSDGFAVGDIGYEQRAIVEGDATSAAIAAASIVAKVTRDRYMHRADVAASGLGVRRPRRLLDARAPRRDPAPRRLAAAPAELPVDGVPAARAAVVRRAASRQGRASHPRATLRAPRPSERRLEVVQAHESRRVVDGHRDDVEAQLARARPVAPLSTSHAAAIPRTWRCLRGGTDSTADPAPAPTRRALTSTKTIVSSSQHDQVELAEARAVVARDRRVAEALEMLEREILAEAAEVLADVAGHDRDATRVACLRATQQSRRENCSEICVSRRSRLRRCLAGLAPLRRAPHHKPA